MSEMSATTRLQRIRMQRRETQRELAAVMGLKSASAYCKKELGYIPITLDEARAVARHWEMSIDSVFFGE